ncbi:GNAT family N-acetyltransferase [Shigella flexneri]
MNDPRVEHFWQQPPHWRYRPPIWSASSPVNVAFPLIGCFDDWRFSYLEIYWAAEDRIGAVTIVAAL